MKKFSYFLTGMMLMFALSCNDKKEEPENIVLPKGVSNVEVNNQEGKSFVSWTLPSDGSVTGAKVLYTLITGGKVFESFVPKENNSIVLRGFGDTDGHKVTIFAVYPNNQLSVGVTVTVYPVASVYRPVTNIQVENLVGRARISWSFPSDEHMDEKLLGVELIYSLADGEEALKKYVPRESNFVVLDGYNDSDKHNVVLIAKYQGDHFSSGVEAIVEPLPHISNIKVVNVVGGATISYTLSSEENLEGIKAVYSPIDGEDEIEIFVSKDENSFEVSGYEDSKEHTVTIYVVYDYKVTTGFKVIVKPLVLVFDPVLNAKVVNIEGGATISWTLPTTNDDVSGAKLVFSYGSGGKEFEINVAKPATSTTLTGYTKSKEHTVTIYATFAGGKISEGVEVKIKPLAPAEVDDEIKRKIGDVFMWSLFDDGGYDPKVAATHQAQNRFIYRGEIYTPTNRSDRGFSNILTGPWECGSGVNIGTHYIWQPGGDTPSDQNLSNFIPAVPTTPITPLPYPLYVSFDMGRKAVYSKMAYIVRFRGNNAFSAQMPVEFTVWGCNNPKKIEEVGDGSREANQAYWTSWAAANGTDAWKKDWTKIATCKYVLANGANAGKNRFPVTALASGSEDLLRYTGKFGTLFENNFGLGYDFDLTTEGVTEAFRYLRWEVHLLNRDEDNDTANNNPNKSFQIYGIKYWGEYAD